MKLVKSNRRKIYFQFKELGALDPFLVNIYDIELVKLYFKESDTNEVLIANVIYKISFIPNILLLIFILPLTFNILRFGLNTLGTTWFLAYLITILIFGLNVHYVIISNKVNNRIVIIQIILENICKNWKKHIELEFRKENFILSSIGRDKLIEGFKSFLKFSRLTSISNDEINNFIYLISKNEGEVAIILSKISDKEFNK